MSESMAALIPAEQRGAGAETHPARLTAPVAAFLAHESCTLDGEIIVTGGGHVARLALTVEPGFDRPELSLEDVAAGLGGRDR
jgi:hypothetical protein